MLAFPASLPKKYIERLASCMLIWRPLNFKNLKN